VPTWAVRGLCWSAVPPSLIDEYVLQIHPLVLGKGCRLFPNGNRLTTFSLVDAVTTVTTGTGVLIATYRPATPH
jgi:dihydrofolate reductase